MYIGEAGTLDAFTLLVRSLGGVGNSNERRRPLVPLPWVGFLPPFFSGMHKTQNIKQNKKKQNK